MLQKLLPTLLFTSLLLTGCNSLQKKERLLSSAGFRAVTPQTAAQSTHLKSLPQGHLTPISKNGRTYFVLADAHRNILLVGNQSQYQTYQQLRLKKQLARDQVATANLNAETSAEWNAWNGLNTPLW